jgi:NADPH:quinone reductase-like Zn-dependent oxidoreductase
MRQYIATAGAGIAGLRLESAPTPEPGPNEALVKLHAATLNFRDLLGLRRALPGMTREPEYLPLSCGAGTVVAIGAGVKRVAVGQRVAPLFDQLWFSGGLENTSWQHLGGQRDGVARELAVFSEDGLSVVPDEISDFEAATLPCAGLTAWSALFGEQPIVPGDVVVLQGTGGVSIAALQFAKMAGAEVVITSSSDAKLARARSYGADYVVNYRRTPAWGVETRKAVGGQGATRVIDVVGSGALAQTVAALAPHGSIAAIGMLDGTFNFDHRGGHRVLKIGVGNREQFEAMVRAMARNRVHPPVDRIFPFDRLPEALELMESGDFFGKIGIAID